MRTCKECGSEMQKVRKSAMFCNKKCANTYKGKQVAKANEGSHIVCEVCGEGRPKGMFSFLVKGDFASGKKPYCKPCGRAAMETQRRDRTWKDDAAKVLLNGSKQRAKKAGMEHTLTYKDIVIPDTCPVLGIPLRREDRETWMNAPSLDRIDNSKGYVSHNVIVVSRRANMLKKDATVEELVAIARFYSSIDREMSHEHFCPT